MRGDVPDHHFSAPLIWPFSPHARGCSSRCTRFPPGSRVFPACAGMFLQEDDQMLLTMGFPRMRGDVPLIGPLLDLVVEFSPHARGCSVFC